MSTEESALFAAIITNPDDDTPRLVYADWLDEHADSLPPTRRESARARAELIRVQVEEGNLVLVGKSGGDRYEELSNRANALIEKHHKSWLAELRGVHVVRGTHFLHDRGLFGEVMCSLKYFVEHGAALFDAAPIMKVQLNRATTSNVRLLGKTPHFSRVRHLQLVADETPHEAIYTLLQGVPLEHLHGLSFNCWFINSTTDAWHARFAPVAGRVAECRRLRGLKRLTFFGAGVGDEGGGALAASPHLADLAILDLRRNPMAQATKSELRARFGSRVWIEPKDMSGYPLRDR